MLLLWDKGLGWGEWLPDQLNNTKQVSIQIK